MDSPLRVALFTDSFREANGVATFSRQFVAFAERTQLPFLCVHSGERTRVTPRQSFTTIELKRGLTAFALDHELYCDPLLSRYKRWVTGQIRPFQPDLIHITGPGDMGIMGFWVAHSLGVPLVASWHTNLHEYIGRRLDKFFSFAPDAWRERASHVAEHQSLRAFVCFYRLARFLTAPNEAAVRFLKERTHKPCFLMSHGVDSDLYSPKRRKPGQAPFCIGYVGRLTPEKNVRLFIALEQALLAACEDNFRIFMVGEGSEKERLRKHLRYGELPGLLRGDALANAFAEMDVFVFPSLTDTFGLVLLEAMASGVPVIVSPDTGSRVGVRPGVTGFHADNLTEFTQGVLCLMRNRALQREMGSAARQFAEQKNWCQAFEQLYQTYRRGLKEVELSSTAAAPNPPIEM